MGQSGVGLTAVVQRAKLIERTTSTSHRIRPARVITFSNFSIRLHPVATLWERHLSQDVVLSGYNVPAGVSINLSTIMIT